MRDKCNDLEGAKTSDLCCGQCEKTSRLQLCGLQRFRGPENVVFSKKRSVSSVKRLIDDLVYMEF